MPRPSPATPSKRSSAASSPFQKLAENTAAQASSTPPKPPGTSPAQRIARSSPKPEPRDPHDAFLTPRALEGTQHRRLRTILQEFIKEATAWEEEHTFDGIRWATEAAQAWDDIYAALAPTDPHGQVQNDDEQRRARVIPLLVQLEQASVHLNKMQNRLEKHAARMQTLTDAAHALMRDMAAGGREKQIMCEPMWGTWSMSRFVRAMSSLSSQYMLSTVHVSTLLPQLCAPPRSEPSNASSKPRSALTMLIKLPCLHTSGVTANAPSFGSDADALAGASRHFFEHICETEVRSWS